jgi:ATPase subunit of ABC transporter with duplicated ATPase domains
LGFPATMAGSGTRTIALTRTAKTASGTSTCPNTSVWASLTQTKLKVSAARQRNLAERYRDAAAAVHGTLRCIGVAARSERPNVTTPIMFVPLTFKVERQGDAEKEWDMAQLVQTLVRRFDDYAFDTSASRIVILGDPGSGKTTLCRYLTVFLATEGEGVTGHAECSMPLFLPFRDYVFTAWSTSSCNRREIFRCRFPRGSSIRN